MSESSEVKEELPQRQSKFPRLTAKSAGVLLRDVGSQSELRDVVLKQVRDLDLDVTPKQVQKQVQKLEQYLPESESDGEPEAPIDWSQCRCYQEGMPLAAFKRLDWTQQRSIVGGLPQAPESFVEYLRVKCG